MATLQELYVWTQRLDKDSAIDHYRIELPMRHLYKQGFARIYEHKGTLNQLAVEAMIHADIGHFYGVQGRDYLHQLQVFRRIKPVVTQNKVKLPPTLIYDLDDNLDFIHPFNIEAFATMGTREYPTGRLLEPGDGLVFHDDHGNEKVMWMDGNRTPLGTEFNIQRNLHDIDIWHQIIRTCHGVTAPSKALASYFKKVVGATNTYMFPNTIDLNMYETHKVVRDEPGTIRILWQGGDSHYIDWWPLRDALKTISQKYPQVKWVIWGAWFDWVHQIIPDNTVEFHEWSPYSTYRLKRSLLDIDINLCPLANNAFNICKSAIKWYEASIWPRPEATLAAGFGPYLEIEDGKTGLLYRTPEEFVEKLSALIENAELRRTVGEGAKEWVMNNRLPEHTIPGLFDFYTEVRAKHKRDMGVPVIQTATPEDMRRLLNPTR